MNEFQQRVRRKKICLYVLLALGSVAMALFAVRIFSGALEKRLNSQVQQAAVQVAQAVPQLEQNEQALNAAYDRMAVSWQKLASSGAVNYEFDMDEDREAFDQLVDETLSWKNQVTNLTVGASGYVMVLDKKTGEVLAHPDERCVGLTYVPGKAFSFDNAIRVSDIKNGTQASDVNPAFMVVIPAELQGFGLLHLSSTGELLEKGLFGSAIDYGNTYIVCGVPLSELASYIALHAVTFLVFFVALMWLLIRWLCLVMDAREETAASLRPKLFSCVGIVCALLLVISWYTQTLSEVTNILKTLSKDANVAAATLDSYDEQRGKINHWLDNYYLNQCWFASQITTSVGREKLTREDLEHYADDLNVKAIYVFDKAGKVVVTNSDYDTFTIGTKPEDLTYGLRPLLDGRSNVVLDPVMDEWYGEPVQYVGVSTRDDQDLCNGFVMIAVDPMLREALLAPLDVNYALGGMAIGLPDDALAIDKASLNIVASLGIGHLGESIETLGLSEGNLTKDFGGFLKINGTKYYAGVSDSSSMYIASLVRSTKELDAFINALKLTAFALAFALIVTLVTLFGYQKMMDLAPAEDDQTDEPGDSEASAPEDDAQDPFFGLANLIKAKKKYGFEDRWDVNRVPKQQMTPEQRILRIIYRLLLVFCLFVLLPMTFLSMTQGSPGLEVGALSYVISGNWQRGLNIFAVTSCLLQLCTMYVVVVLLNRVLFSIARVSNTRVETICLLVKSSAKYICAVVFVYYGLSQFGVDTQTLLASAGLLSLMISFGAQDLVKDILAGFFTIFEGTYKVGDYINVGGWFGAVTEIGLRTTKVTRFADTKVFNNSSVRDIVNSDGEVARIKIQLPVSYDTDLTAIREMFDEELPTIAERIPGLRRGPRYDGVENLGEYAMTLRVTAYVTSYMQGRAQRALAEELKTLLDRKGIEIPVAQVVLHETKGRR